MVSQANHPLPPGLRVDEYTIDRQVSLGGFSLVYLAHDAKGRAVALKEFLPHQLALRGPGAICPSIPDEHRGTFRYGVRCFFEEGAALAKVKHPNVVEVYNFFRANDTVYLAMRYEEGRTLQELLRDEPGKVNEAFLRGLFTRLLNGLRAVHRQQLLHLDIKPANIYVRWDDTPVLIDFGAARQVLNQQQPILKPTYTPGFASPEHHNNFEQLGPWSDIYGVGASLYACLAGGIAPLAVDQRRLKDTLVPARERWRGHYSDNLLRVIDHCLALDHERRPQSVFAVQKALAPLTTADDGDAETLAASAAATAAVRPASAPGEFGQTAVRARGWLARLMDKVKRRR